MNLFKCSHQSQIQKKELNTLIYSTPLGSGFFDFHFNGVKISKIEPSRVESTDKATILCWDLKECHVEFLQAKFMPKIPASMKIESTIAGVWRIESLSNSLKPVFTAEFNGIELEIYSETGEGLVSQTFENRTFKVSIGTEDEEFLAARANAKKWMPHRFENDLNSSTVECTPSGLQISLPELECHEQVQVQFIIACSLKEHSEESPWFAVDQSPEYILDSLEIS